MGLKDFFRKKKKAEPVKPATEAAPSNDAGAFPTYEDAIDDDMFIQSSKAQEIADNEPFGWEYLLFAQSVKDCYTFLRQFRQQTDNNPYVERIGNDSEGASYPEYISGMISNLDLETERFNSKFAIIIRQYTEAMGAEGEDGDADAIAEVAIRFMDPYIGYLGFYNDIRTVEPPSGLSELHSLIIKMVECLLESCEKLYDDIYQKWTYLVAHPDTAGENALSLKFAPEISGNLLREYSRLLSSDSIKTALLKATVHRINR